VGAAEREENPAAQETVRGTVTVAVQERRAALNREPLAEAVVSTIALQEAKKRPLNPMYRVPTLISSPVRSPTLHRPFFYPPVRALALA
jgi:hypothetical protein